MTPFPQCLIQLSKVVCVISDIYWTVVLWYSEVGYSMSWCVIKVCYHSKENRAQSRPSQQSKKCKARPSLRSPSLFLLNRVTRVTRVARVTCSSLMLPTTTHWYCHHHLAGLNTNRCFANIHMNALLGMNSCPEVILVAVFPSLSLVAAISPSSQRDQHVRQGKGWNGGNSGRKGKGGNSTTQPWTEMNPTTSSHFGLVPVSKSVE